MMMLRDRLDERAIARLEQYVSEGIKNAAVGFAGLLGQSLSLDQPEVGLINLPEINRMIDDPENEAVGIYLNAEGDLGAQIMLVIPFKKALELVDLLMELPPGTTTTLGRVERSALGEVGNMAGTFFLNSLAAMTGLSVRPTPPAMIVDMVGAIMDIIAAAAGSTIEDSVLMKTTFTIGERTVDVEFWVIPDAHTIDTLVEKAQSYE